MTGRFPAVFQNSDAIKRVNAILAAFAQYVTSYYKLQESVGKATYLRLIKETLHNILQVSNFPLVQLDDLQKINEIVKAIIAREQFVSKAFQEEAALLAKHLMSVTDKNQEEFVIPDSPAWTLKV